MKHLMKYLTTPLAFAAVFLLFGAPSAPGTALVPTVGGQLAAAPCPYTDPWQCVMRDSDGDGVLDIRDACPDTWGSGANGCPPSREDCERAANITLAVGGVMAGTGFFLALNPHQSFFEWFGSWAGVAGGAAMGVIGGVHYLSCQVLY